MIKIEMAYVVDKKGTCTAIEFASISEGVICGIVCNDNIEKEKAYAEKGEFIAIPLSRVDYIAGHPDTKFGFG